MYIYSKRARIKDDEVHNKVVDKFTEIERSRNFVILGFVGYWFVWLCLVGATIWYYFL